MLSAVVITLNEESNLERCLQSLAFCDEIVVIDSGSVDATLAIARRYTDKVYTLPWRGYTAQKNEGVRLATHPWVLSLDADEEVPASLRNEILETLRQSTPHVGFSIPRKHIHFGKWIRHGGWYPNRLIRLFRKDCGEWVGEELHERWEPKGSTGELHSDLMHYSFRDLSDQVARNNRYSSLGAVRLYKRGRKFSSVRLFLKSTSKFLETYFLKRGFLDGYPGFIISVSAAYSVFLKWAKLWELENGGEKT